MVSIINSVTTDKVITLTIWLPALPGGIYPTIQKAHSDKFLAVNYLTCHGRSRNSSNSWLKRHLNFIVLFKIHVLEWIKTNSARKNIFKWSWPQVIQCLFSVVRYSKTHTRLLSSGYICRDGHVPAELLTGMLIEMPASHPVEINST